MLNRIQKKFDEAHTEKHGKEQETDNVDSPG